MTLFQHVDYLLMYKDPHYEDDMVMTSYLYNGKCILMWISPHFLMKQTPDHWTNGLMSANGLQSKPGISQGKSARDNYGILHTSIIQFKMARCAVY